MSDRSPPSNQTETPRTAPPRQSDERAGVASGAIRAGRGRGDVRIGNQPRTQRRPQGRAPQIDPRSLRAGGGGGSRARRRSGRERGGGCARGVDAADGSDNGTRPPPRPTLATPRTPPQRPSPRGRRNVALPLWLGKVWVGDSLTAARTAEGGGEHDERSHRIAQGRAHTALHSRRGGARAGLALAPCFCAHMPHFPCFCAHMSHFPCFSHRCHTPYVFARKCHTPHMFAHLARSPFFPHVLVTDVCFFQIDRCVCFPN